MTASADCLVSTKVLFSDYPFSFFPLFYPFITDNCNLFRGYKNEDLFSLLTIIYPKINMNVVKTILPWQ